MNLGGASWKGINRWLSNNKYNLSGGVILDKSLIIGIVIGIVVGIIVGLLISKMFVVY